MQKILSDHKKTFLLFLAISLLFFGNSIRNSFSFDDSYVTVTNFKKPGQKYVPDNPSVAMGFAGIPKIWQSRYGHGNGTAYDYRPVVNTFFAIEYAIFGQSPHANHFINVVLYACILFLLFLVLKKILSAYSFNQSFAFLCCLLFAAHPLHTEVVNSLKSRDELLGLLFGLLCLWQVLLFSGTKKVIRLVWAVLFLLLAVYSKLSAAVFIAIIPLTLWMFTGTEKRRVLFFVGAGLLVYFIHALFKKWIVTEKEFRLLYHFENPMATEYFSFSARILFALKTLGIYLKLLVFPWPLRYYYGCAVITSNVSMGDPDVWVAIIFSATAIWFCYRSKNKLAIYGLLVFFISIAPVVNFARPVAGIVGERLAFIPSLGFLFFVTAIVFHFYKNPPAGFSLPLFFKRPVMYLTIFIPVFLIYDWKRNTYWKDEITLFEHDAPYLMKSAAANNLLANKYAEFLYAGNSQYTQEFLIEKCWQHYNLAIVADSSVYAALNNAGTIAFRFLDKPHVALGYFLRCVRIQPEYPQAYENIGDCYFRLGRKKEAVVNYRKAISQNAAQFHSYLQIASVYMDIQEYNKALSVLSDAEKIFPHNYEVIERKGFCYYLQGEKQKGLDILEQAYTLYPNKVLALKLAACFEEQGQKEKAVFYNEKAVQ